jgi:hypothetical protein
MTENRGADPTPRENRGPDPEPPDSRRRDPKPADAQGISLTPADSPAPGPKPAGDDIRWLIYLAIGLVAFLALVAWSGFHNAMGH